MNRLHLINFLAYENIITMNQIKHTESFSSTVNKIYFNFTYRLDLLLNRFFVFLN